MTGADRLHQQPTAAAEIVKAARAYLQDPTRPVTPADASARHLLQSSCGYSNRPQSSNGVARSVGQTRRPACCAGSAQQQTTHHLCCCCAAQPRVKVCSSSRRHLLGKLVRGRPGR